MRSHRFSACAALVALTFGSLAPVREARAAGLYFGDRGVRPLGRGGAFVAGADDLGAVAYNPAGVFDAGSQFLFDASWVRFGNEYTRRAWVEQRDPNTGEVLGGSEVVYPTVRGQSAVLPLPTLAASFRLRDDLVLAVGAFAPYAAIMSYPELLGGKPAPQRYSLLTLEGSGLGFVGSWLGWKPSERFRVGGGVELLVGKFGATTMFSACVPDRFLCAPEQPDWDTLMQITAGPIVAPSGVVGGKFLATPRVTLGAAVHAPFFVRAPVTVRSRLPSRGAFASAVQEGDRGSIAFELPWTASLGVEVRPLDALRVELAASLQGWGMHEAIRVSPDDVVLRNVVGFPDPYKLPTQRLERGFRDAVAVRLGGEYRLAFGDVALTLRGGGSFESSAVPPEKITVLTVDGPKGTVSVGTGISVGKWRFDAVYAHVFVGSTDLDPRDARAPLLVPVQANAAPYYVNGGSYASSGDVLGIGLAYQLGSVAPPRHVEIEAAPSAAREKGEPASVR
ncbi:MAG: outer membrane protein transport protein [Deltaproteobacteria bacterium]|nr:outer membrane protein transport protein [Deltaproteobacteria bacterium]